MKYIQVGGHHIVAVKRVVQAHLHPAHQAQAVHQAQVQAMGLSSVRADVFQQDLGLS